MEGLCRINGLLLVILAVIFTNSASSSDYQQNNQISTFNSALENAITEHSTTTSYGAPANGETAGDKMAAPRHPFSEMIMREKTDCAANADSESKGKSADGNQRNEANPKGKHGKSTKIHQFATRTKRSKAVEADPELRRNSDSGVNFLREFEQYPGFRSRGMKGGGIIDGRWNGDVNSATNLEDLPKGGDQESLQDIVEELQEGQDDGDLYVQQKRNRIVEGFLGMRGKKAQDRKLFDGFFGMRGKKETEVKRRPVADAFYGMRGKKEGTKRVPADAFYGMRGKKLSPGQNGGGDESDTDSALDGFGDGSNMVKRIPEGFLGMRGKKSGTKESRDPSSKSFSKRMVTGGRRMLSSGAPYQDFVRGLFERSRANGNDRKRQIGSIFIGMRG